MIVCPCCGMPAEHMDPRGEDNVVCPECHWSGTWEGLVAKPAKRSVPDWHEDCREPY